MIPDDNIIQSLVTQPRESLSVEIKRWVDPADPTGAAKIVKGVFALRNFNGGFLIIGFDDKTLQPDLANEPPDVRSTFHQDNIQRLISRHAHERFEVHVAFGQRDGHSYPVIVVPEGVQVPAVLKADLGNAKKMLLSRGEIYFRSLNSNGTPSSTIARPEDWKQLLQICFDNREADIGRFLRRQLSDHTVASLLSELRKVGEYDGGEHLGFIVPSARASEATWLKERCAAVLALGEKSVIEAVNERGLSKAEKGFLERLQWHVALVVQPQMNDAIPDREFFAKFVASNPNYTGWPVWLDARTLSDERARPVVRNGAWEALIVRIEAEIASRFEFFRLDPKGAFYLRRLLQDDAVPSRVEPGTRLDPILVIIRVAEAIAVGLSVAKGLGWSQETVQLGFAFRWRKLKGRRLDSWTNPIVYVPGGGASQQDEVTTFIEMALDTPLSAISPLVDAATRDLFVAFDGTRLSQQTVEEWTRRLIERRLNS